MEKKYYYQVVLNVALTTSDYEFGFINISDISYEKFYELFSDQVKHERFLFDESLSYTITRELYKKHKKFFDDKISFTFDFNLFEYSVSLVGDLYEKMPRFYYDELPPGFKR